MALFIRRLAILKLYLSEVSEENVSITFRTYWFRASVSFECVIVLRNNGEI